MKYESCLHFALDGYGLSGALQGVSFDREGLTASDILKLHRGLLELNWERCEKGTGEIVACVPSEQEFFFVIGRRYNRAFVEVLTDKGTGYIRPKRIIAEWRRK